MEHGEKEEDGEHLRACAQPKNGRRANASSDVSRGAPAPRQAIPSDGDASAIPYALRIGPGAATENREVDNISFAMAMARAMAMASLSLMSSVRGCWGFGF